MLRILTIIITISIILGIGFFVFNAYIYKQKQGSGEVTPPYPATLSGEYVCLPHIDATGQQTDGCANGILTDVGEYYAVDFNLIAPEPSVVTIGDHFTASGVVTPIE